MKKNVLALLITFSALFVTCSGAFAAGGNMGGTTQDGSAEHPYLIEDFADFQAFCTNTSY